MTRVNEVKCDENHICSPAKGMKTHISIMWWLIGIMLASSVVFGGWKVQDSENLARSISDTKIELRKDIADNKYDNGRQQEQIDAIREGLKDVKETSQETLKLLKIFLAKQDK